MAIVLPQDVRTPITSIAYFDKVGHERVVLIVRRTRPH
jgi:hypothetical protein